MSQSAKKFILTKGGLAELRDEFNELVKEKRPAIAQRIQRAREFGDLSENSEYDAAKEEQSLNEARISELEEVLKRAQIIQPYQKTGFVVIGSTVVVEVEAEVDKFMIVGTMEAHPATRKISNESPVGSALLGAKVGDVVEVATPIFKASYKVLEIK